MDLSGEAPGFDSIAFSREEVGILFGGMVRLKRTGRTAHLRQAQNPLLEAIRKSGINFQPIALGPETPAQATDILLTAGALATAYLHTKRNIVARGIHTGSVGERRAELANTLVEQVREAVASGSDNNPPVV